MVPAFVRKRPLLAYTLLWVGILVVLYAAIWGVFKALQASDAVVFADPKLEEQIKRQVRVRRGTPKTTKDVLLRSFMKNVDTATGVRPLSKKEMERLTQVSIGGMVPLDMQGVEHAKNLKSLTISACGVVGLKPLKELLLSKVRFYACHSIEARSLQDINCGTIQIDRSTLHGIESLRRWSGVGDLSLNQCRLKEVSFLAKAESINVLSLRDNDICDVKPLETLPVLRYLDLRDNSIADISPLVRMSGLLSLVITGNPLNEEAFSTHIPALQKRGVRVVFEQNLQHLPSAKRLVSSGWKASWSPDGTRLVFGKPYGKGLQILSVQSGEITDLTSSGKDAAWSPDGRFIAFVKEPSFNATQSEEVWLIKPDGESLRKVMDGGYPHWSGDGETVFMHSRREKKVFASDVDDLDGKPEEFFAEPQSIYPAVSPDGQRIAFGDSGFLIISDRETGETVLTWAAPGSRGLLPAWSPDGKHVAFGGFDNDLFGLWILDVNMEKAVQVARGRYTMPAWSKDGKKIAFDVRSGSTREIWSVDVNTILELHGETNETNEQQVP